MKGDKMAKRSSFGNMVRRRLSDITNSPVFQENLPIDSASTKELIDHLVKEKMALVKHIQEKNKIIELTGIEIQNLRSFLQKMQMQNWSLAQSNSHMLAELNMGKERLKALQHEVACKDALLKTKNFELNGQEIANLQKDEFQESKTTATEPGCEEGTKPSNASTRRGPSRSRSLGSSTVSQQHGEKEAVGSKRRCLRRQSASFRIQHQEPTENLFEIDEAKFPNSMPLNSPINEVGSTLLPLSTKKEVEESGRTSIARPSRKAAVKVQSYKEKPINVKMRRTE